MRTLVLSCNTGAGHNSCALALQQQLRANGEACDITDALQFISERASRFISNWHTRIYLHAPRLFGAGYQDAERHEKLFREDSLLYRYITSGVEELGEYILSGGYDCVLCTHIFPALALTELCRRYPDAPFTTAHISTDYTCSPGLSDSALDWYFIPDASLADEFAACGIPREKLVPAGIPVRQEFLSPCVQGETRRMLLMCGSMGCGPMEELAVCLSEGMTQGEELDVVCGSNEELRERLSQQTAQAQGVRIHGRVDNVPQLMQRADLFLTKPGGLSTSEAAAAGLPMVLIDAVAGCEEPNLAFFLRRGMAVTADTPAQLASLTLATLRDEAQLSRMRAAGENFPSRSAAKTIDKWMHHHAK